MKIASKIGQLARVLTALGLLAALGGLAACAKTGTSPVRGAAPPVGGGTATLKLVEPGAGSQVAAGSVTVRVETTGLKYVMPSNTNVAGEGHVHFTLDDLPFVMSVKPEAQIKDVAAGPHTLKAELVQNNTQSFDPPIKQVIEFTAQ